MNYKYINVMRKLVLFPFKIVAYPFFCLVGFALTDFEDGSERSFFRSNLNWRKFFELEVRNEDELEGEKLSREEEAEDSHGDSTRRHELEELDWMGKEEELADAVHTDR